jgi:octaprenyl-diphosphate synthase
MAHSPKDGIGQCLGLVADELAQVKQFIDRQLVTANEGVDSLLQCINARYGKMLRPGIALLAGKCCGRITQTHIALGAVLEMIHIASLLHDDVIDEADSRRGVPSISAVHGNEAAVLLGDFLLSKVFLVNAQFQTPGISETLAKTAVDLCRGELLQNTQRRNWRLDEETYLDIVKDKTASLFGTSCYLGALAARGDEAAGRAMMDYGINLGMAFQITDDLLDIIGDENKMGKSLGADMANHKLTLPMIHLLRTINDKDKVVVIKELSGDEKPRRLPGILNRSDSVSYTMAKATYYCDAAMQALTALADSPAKTMLVRITGLICTRIA